MHPDNHDVGRRMLLGGLCGAVISGACTFNILMLLLFHGHHLPLEFPTYDLRPEDISCLFRDFNFLLLIAGGALPGGIIGMFLGGRMGRRKVPGGFGLVIGGATLPTLTVTAIVLLFIPLGSGGFLFPPLATFGAALVGIAGASIGLFIGLQRPAKTTPDLLPDPGWGPDIPSEKGTPPRPAPAQSDAHIMTNPGQVFRFGTGEQDAPPSVQR